MKLLQTCAAKFRRIKKLSFLFIVVLLSVASLPAQSGQSVDLSFNAAVTKDVTSNYTGNFALQPDGKVIIFGRFLGMNSEILGSYFKRLNTDGTEDTSFNCAVCSTLNIVNAAVQADGKILVAGSFGFSARIVRINSDGSLDTSYASPFTTSISGSSFAQVMAIQPDGKAIVKEQFNSQGTGRQSFYRLNTDGSFDATFSTIDLGAARNYASVVRVVVLPDGKLLLGGATTLTPSSGFLYRYNPNGTRDTTFESPSLANQANFARTPIYDFDVQADGKIIVVGAFTSVNSVNRQNIVRLMPAGNVDLSFTPANVFNGEGAAEKVRLLFNGQILIYAVNFNITSPGIPPRLYLFNADGTLDNSYIPPTNLNAVSQLEIDASNRAYIFGNFSGVLKYARLNANGSLDTSFNAPLLAMTGTVNALARQADGKILIGGDFNRVNGTLKNNLARVNADGTTDSSFDTGSGLDTPPGVIVAQTDGKILVGGGFSTYNGVSKPKLLRLNSNGSIDTTFNGAVNADVYSIVPLPNGKILIGGNFTTVNGAAQAGLAQLNADGSLDASFAAVLANPIIRAISAEADGKIVVGGSFSGINGFNRLNLARLNANGTVDASFNAGTISSVFQLIRQADGKYLVLGSASLTRLNNNGTADNTFQSPTVNGQIKTIFLQPDGNIIVGGAFTAIGGKARNNFARLTQNGALDLLFFSDGANAEVNTIIGQPDGRIVVGGRFSIIGGAARSGIARITPSIYRRITNFDYDGDGKADVSVFRPSENKWYVLRSSDFGVTQKVFAVGGDVPAPADFDGDGKTDFAVFRPSSGDWWYSSSISNQQVFAHWGAAGDAPRPSDFDGDGRADYVLFRPSNFFWYRAGSTSAISNTQFGSAGDKAVTGDFDGDGKSDRAIYRPSTGDWWWQSSVDNVQRATRWGIATDVPAPADYDGDGKTDFAVFRPATGVWYISNSGSGSATITAFGLSEDKPVAADYDGDGRADIAVFRPSTGIWYLLRSTEGFTALQFGISTDIPTPNAFVPQ